MAARAVTASPGPSGLVALCLGVIVLGGCQPSMPPSAPVTRNGDDRVAGRDFLLPVQAESTTPEPYGLYSYLLFAAEPSETARPRYLEVIRSYLQMLPPVQRLEREGAPRRMLNVTYVPVESQQAVAAAQAADAQAAETVLRNYSYARARVLLAKVPGGPHLDGPYVISYREPLSRVARLAGEYGWVNMSGVPAARVNRWVRIFLRETAQQEYWHRGMTARVWTSILDELDKAGEGAPQVLKAVVFWTGST